MVELEGQLGLMEQQCHSLNRDKEQLEEEVHDQQALLHQAALDAQQAQAHAAQAAHTSHAKYRHILIHSLLAAFSSQLHGRLPQSQAWSVHAKDTQVPTCSRRESLSMNQVAENASHGSLC